ncbi:hypothetical protein ABZ079_15730 [Streptomyces sp. NPDC006314]|uniref:hypothetical protein n=1 Tax=Streptomyces sp. NPDC006314 TaxID=3154475 RepID=UPI0033A77772
MSNPQGNEFSHPLEQVTGEKDVHPEEEEGRQQPQTSADAPADEDDTDAEGAPPGPAGL